MEYSTFEDAFKASTNDLAVCTAELVKLKDIAVELMGLVAKRDRQLFEKDAFIHAYRTQLKDCNLQLNDFATEDALKSKRIEALKMENSELAKQLLAKDSKYLFLEECYDSCQECWKDAITQVELRDQKIECDTAEINALLLKIGDLKDENDDLKKELSKLCG